MKYEVRQALDPKFVRSPDYVWCRLHGYAYAPGTSGLDEEIVELHNWLSDDLKDNFATSFYAPPATIPHTDYHHSRLEGLILSPDTDREHPGIVPLYNWVSLNHSDNFATTDPVYTRPLVARIDPDYEAPALLGFLFSPHRPPPANTVPIHHWFSRSRRDNFITSHEVWRP